MRRRKTTTIDADLAYRLIRTGIAMGAVNAYSAGPEAAREWGCLSKHEQARAANGLAEVLVEHPLVRAELEHNLEHLAGVTLR